ncbi:hypothetical protein [Microbacterium phyllosphaerae]|uniref:hypothetical protein n=1 Tax=Microbacterium phyllosphaerae TaxID=124798 RepID=UPI002168740C|nr:hypothetical protein [Microbacterium phyllosphaerae]MCS3443298.1 hypothetical protein [Microbacterium phyllosphaerae]
MTRISQVSPLVRLAAVSVVALAVLPLSGCLYAQIPADVPDGDGPDPSPTASPTDEASGDLPSTLTFDEGAALAPSAYIQWGDGFVVDDGWKIVKPDDGNGGWTYGTVDDTCTAQFWQGQIPDVPTVAGDDSVSSDAMLAVILGETDAAAVTPLATTGAFSYQIGGNADVENRQVEGEAGERTWSMAARAFTATGVGLYVIVDCTGGDIDATMAEVIDKNAVVVQ